MRPAVPGEERVGESSVASTVRATLAMPGGTSMARARPVSMSTKRGERRTKRLSAPVVGPIGGGAGGATVAPLARQESLEAPFEEDPHRFHAVTKHLLMDDDSNVIRFNMPDSSSEQLSNEGKFEHSPSLILQNNTDSVLG